MSLATNERAAIAQAIFDPGAFVGYKGERTLTEWQVDAVMKNLETFRSSNEASLNFMEWVNQGPALALKAGLYVGIKIYASEQAARDIGDIQ